MMEKKLKTNLNLVDFYMYIENIDESVYKGVKEILTKVTAQPYVSLAFLVEDDENEEEIGYLLEYPDNEDNTMLCYRIFKNRIDITNFLKETDKHISLKYKQINTKFIIELIEANYLELLNYLESKENKEEKKIEENKNERERATFIDILNNKKEGRWTSKGTEDIEYIEIEDGTILKIDANRFDINIYLNTMFEKCNDIECEFDKAYKALMEGYEIKSLKTNNIFGVDDFDDDLSDIYISVEEMRGSWIIRDYQYK